MEQKTPRLRDSSRPHVQELYPLNQIPNEIVVKICGHIVFLSSVSRKDLSGDDFGDAFATAINGMHLARPLGIADVVLEKMAWSVKTVKVKNPWQATSIRLISGRNSPVYSYGIEDPLEDIQKTGDAVLGIWNERVNIAYSQFNLVRTLVLIRSDDLSQFVLFEEDTRSIRATDYRWELNTHNNLLGINKNTGETCFTWQPHGSQFTIHTKIPPEAKRFSLKKPKTLDEKEFLLTLKYNESWVHCLDR